MAIIQTTLKDGTILDIEVDSPPGLRQAKSNQVIIKVEGAIDTAVERSLMLAEQFAPSIRQAADGIRPDSASIQFGLKFGGEGGVVLAKASAEANLSVSLTWNL